MLREIDGWASFRISIEFLKNAFEPIGMPKTFAQQISIFYFRKAKETRILKNPEILNLFSRLLIKVFLLPLKKKNRFRTWHHYTEAYTHTASSQPPNQKPDYVLRDKIRIIVDRGPFLLTLSLSPHFYPTVANSRRVLLALSVAENRRMYAVDLECRRNPARNIEWISGEIEEANERFLSLSHSLSLSLFHSLVYIIRVIAL